MISPRAMIRLCLLGLLCLLALVSCSGSGGESAQSNTDDSDADSVEGSDDVADAGSDEAASAGAVPPTTEPTTTTTGPPATTTSTLPDPLPGATPDDPFPALPASDDPAVLVTDGNIVAPVVRSISDGYFVRTPCSNQRLLFDARTVARAHVVLDAGHGGREIGSVGPSGLREKDVNLAVVTRTKELLEAQGATVVLTRTGDYSITTAARGEIATALAPYVFVSVHHNGGAPANGDRPGTIVFTKGGNAEAKRFGGIFHDQLEEMLLAAAALKQAEYDEYSTQKDAYDTAVEEYEAAVAAREAQATATAEAGDDAGPPETRATPREEPGTDTAPDPTGADPTTPDSGDELTPPEPFELEAPAPFGPDDDPQFRFAGQGNAGVRSWVRGDGEDYLSVLRNSHGIPAVLTEFLYLTNPVEEVLLADPAFIDAEAKVLADSIVTFVTTDTEGGGHVRDQHGDQNIGGGGRPSDCNETL